jgi:hypothetical protein
MDILNSDWLIKMLEKSSQTPRGRLLSLFDILEDWLEAPSIREQIAGYTIAKQNGHLLQDYLTLQASKANAYMPEMLANQLYFMAIAATQEKLHAKNEKSLMHAKNAANALIFAQTKKEFRITKPSAYAIVASFVGTMIVAGGLFIINSDQATRTPHIVPAEPLIQPVSTTSELIASPEQTAALIAQIELMRHGNCHFIEALQLPDNIKGIYINMVVHGQVSTDPREQQIAMELIKKTRCNYTPMLMANSTS